MVPEQNVHAVFDPQNPNMVPEAVQKFTPVPRSAQHSPTLQTPASVAEQFPGGKNPPSPLPEPASSFGVTQTP